MNTDFIAIDFETATGHRDSACAIGIAVVEDLKVVDTFYSLIQPPGLLFHPGNVRIHGITPKTVIKSVRDLMDISAPPSAKDAKGMKMTEKERKAEIERLEKKMKEAAKLLEFEIAAQLRDRIIKLKGEK